MVHAGATCDFCFYDTPVAMRVSVSISMSGTTAFKRCILGAMAVRTTTIGHASDSGGWSVLALGVSHSFGRHHLILAPAWSFGFRKVGIFARGFFGLAPQTSSWLVCFGGSIWTIYILARSL